MTGIAAHDQAIRTNCDVAKQQMPYHAAMNAILNIAAYKFVLLEDLKGLREHLTDQAHLAGLKGTILLAPEGINLFLAGVPESVHRFLRELRRDTRLADLQTKESWSDHLPFQRMRVRLKREIIRMNHPAIQPAQGRAPAVDATTLRRWCDAGRDDHGRPLLLLDTRNRFEVQAGRFSGARSLDLQRFSQFPDAVSRILPELQGHAVVSYCTGGIRCEKAALYLQEIGIRHHWQLDGGILKYFEVVGGAHFEGVCTVFDERAALDADLRPDALSGACSAESAP
jgi:UPF0176 protein